MPPKQHLQRRRAAADAYNHAFIFSGMHTIMEAEQLNALASRFADLAQRANELRRYL